MIDCRRCPRLVAWREQVARERKAAFAEQEYWGRPLPGFGDPQARVLVLGLAPGRARREPDRQDVHGRSLGRFPVCGDVARGPGQPADLDGARGRLAAARRVGDRGRALRAAGEQTDAGGARRVSAWSVRELELLDRVQVILCLGAFAWDAALRLSVSRSCSAEEGGSQRSGRPRGSLRDRARVSATAPSTQGRAIHADRLLSPEPAEHVHGQADRADDRRRARARAVISPRARAVEVRPRSARAAHPA